MLFPYDTGDMSTCVAYTSIVIENQYTNAWDNVNDPVHTYSQYSFSYENGYMNSGKLVYKCTGCDKTKEEITPALFECYGYSTPIDGRGAISIGYSINSEAIKKYEEATGKTLKYGVFAVLKDKIGTNDIFNESGNASDGVINAEVSGNNYVAVEFKITGFTDEYKDLKLAMGAYVITSDGESAEYSYLQGGNPNENEKYFFVSYNDIVGKTSTEE